MLNFNIEEPGVGLTMGLKFYTIKLKDRIGLGSGFVSIHF